jgi:hypothetical protein
MSAQQDCLLSAWETVRFSASMQADLGFQTSPSRRERPLVAAANCTLLHAQCLGVLRFLSLPATLSKGYDLDSPGNRSTAGWPVLPDNTLGPTAAVSLRWETGDHLARESAGSVWDNERTDTDAVTLLPPLSRDALRGIREVLPVPWWLVLAVDSATGGRRVTTHRRYVFA